jgi:translin
MADLEEIGRRVRATFDSRSQARDQALLLSREAIRSCANSIRAAHRGELERARELLRAAGEAIQQIRTAVAAHPELHTAGYVHDCQKEFAEATAFLAIIAGEPLPDPDALGVEYSAFLNGLGETIGEVRRHTLDVMRHGDLDEAERLLNLMDEIYHLLVTIDYPDAVTGGLRRTTDSVRGIIEKTRGEMTVALRQETLRAAIRDALSVLRPGEPPAAASADAVELLPEDDA